MNARKPISLFLCLMAAALGWAQSAGIEASGPAQSAADALRDAAGADGAFIAAGMVKSTWNRDDLASLMQFPDDEIVVVTIKGSEIRQAFERSISLHPQSNTSFLQISGFEVVFDPNGNPGQRIKSVSAGGGKLEDGRDYQIAMPSSLGRGGFGYFRIWDRGKIAKTLDVTVGKALAGKKVTESRPRWVAQ